MSDPLPTPRAVINPSLFSVGILGIKLYNWQAFILDDLFTHKRVTFRAPNGSGKTANILTSAALYMASEYAGSTTVVTSATYDQLIDQVFFSIKRHKEKFTGWKWNEDEISTPQGSRIIGRATNKSGRFEGFHAFPDKPLLMIVDEAKSIPEEIFVAIDRCHATYLMYLSSPGGSIGRFYDSFNNPLFKRHVISAKDCPHITPELIAEAKAQYGEDSDIYRSMILGEFSSGLDDGCVIPYSAYENCLRAPPPERLGQTSAFCDFAETTDENVLAVCKGNKIVIADAWTQLDGSRSEIKDRFIRGFRNHNLSASQIMGDGDGMGGGYCMAFADSGWPISVFRNKNYPNANRYFNPSAEAWFSFADAVRNCQVILPHDDLLKRQLCTRRKVIREDGRLQLEPKRKMAGKSPDRADAVVGAWYARGCKAYNYLQKDDMWDNQEEGGEETSDQEGIILGAHAGY